MAINKKVVYQITKTKYQMIEVETLEEEEIIKELNRDFDRNEKREKVIQTKCISLEYLYEKTGYEPVDMSLTGEQAYDKEIFNERLHQAIDSLTPKQKEVIKMYFWENKTFREIGEELKIHFTTVKEIYDNAIKKLKKYLTNL